jgi:hypothetical protein
LAGDLLTIKEESRRLPDVKIDSEQDEWPQQDGNDSGDYRLEPVQMGQVVMGARHD